MFKTWVVLFLILSGKAFAQNLRIHSVTPDFVKFENGTVGHFSSEKTLSFARFFLRPGQDVVVTLNEQNVIESILPGLTLPESEMSPAEILPAGSFRPSILRNYTTAKNVLNKFRTNDLQDSQCYDRAHVWTYEALVQQNTELGKTWLFFADHYIKKNKFKWWFHIAPVAKVIMKGAVEYRIMDREFSIYPLQMKLWTDKFMIQKQECRTVELYTDYSEHPDEDDCYIIHSTPYFWQPKDLEAFADSREEKTNYLMWELRHAYEHAYGLKKNF